MKPDLVYILGHQDEYEELRYSLRSIKWIQHGSVWIVGAPPPSWCQNVEWLPVDQKPDYQDRWWNQRNNIYQACHFDDISDPFVLMDDDFIILLATHPLPIVHEGPLRDHRTFRDNHQSGYGRYYSWATEHGIPEPYYFAEHRPMLMGKQVMGATHEQLHDFHYPVPTAYGNAAGLLDDIDCVSGQDATLHPKRMIWEADEWQVSTYEKDFHTQPYGDLIRFRTPEKSVYER